ncbi:MAG TPA: tetratricopeptide repeat protein [Candidatus Nitrosotalea sp.]|nr:tetratricopeptide repeat protein [Candidatus Nitrosotalea sp.]
MKSGSRRALIVLIVGVTVVAFWPGLQGQFLNWDDGALFTKNPDYRGLGPDQLRWMFTTTLAGHYMPLTWLTLGLNYALGGMDPWGYHLLALLLHSTNAVLFYLVANRLLGTVLARSEPGTPEGGAGEREGVRAGAFVAALVFAVHPQRAESVAWVTERGTLISSALYLIAVLCYLRATERGAALRWRWWGVTSLASFATAFLAKGMVVTLPATLLLLDIYPLGRSKGRWRSALSEKLPYALIALVGAAIVVYARTRGAHWSGLSEYGLTARLAFAGYSFWFYPSSLVWPIGLSPLYEVPARVSVVQWRFLAPLVGLAAVTTVLVALRRRFPGGLAAWINSALVVAPVSGIAHSGSQLVSDRYSYMAGLGFALIAGYVIPWTARLRRQGRMSGWAATTAAAGMIVLVAALALGTWVQTGIWHDSETLWRWAVYQDPACATCYAGLGEAVLYSPGGAQARLDESEGYLRRAIALHPWLPFPRYTLGTLLLVRGQYAEAEASLKAYIQLAPGEPAAPARLALLYLAQDRPVEAVPLLLRSRQLGARPPRWLPDPPAGPNEPRPDPDFAEAIRLLPDSLDDLEFLGRSLIDQGKGDRAAYALRRAVTLAPGAAGPRILLVRAYEQSGRLDLARQEVATLRRLHPDAADRLSVR